MKNRFFVLVLAGLAFTCFGTFAEASNPTEILSFDGVESLIESREQPAVPQLLGPGSPDPTGQRRYIQYGAPVSYPGATILGKDEIPESKCKRPGEMVGAYFWNTVQENQAMFSKLSEDARIATLDDGRTFLCRCVKGYNQIFLAKSQEVPVRQAENIVQTQDRVIDRQGNVTQTTNITFSPLPPYERTTAPVAPNYCGKKNDCDDDDGPNWTKRILIGVGVAAAGYAVYHFTRDHPGPGADTNPIKPFCTGSGCPKAPSTGAGFSFSW